jgi:hypothetical protein
MAETPCALVKDLRSTGYFFEELKNYNGSQEIHLTSFSKDFAVPYLAKKSESYQKTGRIKRAKILDLAVKFLREANDGEMEETIFGLKKVAASEVDTNAIALYGTDRFEKSELLLCRQKLEEAQSLGKLLISIIRVFKLAEVIGKQDNSEGACDSICDAIKQHWKPSVLPGA